MTNTERDTLLIKMSNKIFNGFDQSIERLNAEVRTMRKMLWGLLSGLLLLGVGVVIDILLHLPKVTP